VVAAGVVQAGVALGRGGMEAPMDHLRFSAPARFVLERRPALYPPDPEVFAERATGADEPPPGPYVYADATGRCRKALAQKRHLPELRERCGEARGVPDFRALVARESRDAWAYIDY
jgi:hypothetical protein